MITTDTNWIYLDHAAATPMADFVVEAMQPYFSDYFFNPSSPYAPAVQVRRDYEAGKQQIAECLGVKKDELVMTAGATESINLAFRAISAQAHVVTTMIEHHAVLAAAAPYNTIYLQPNEKGIVEPESVEKSITPLTELVSIALANNELGTIQPIKKIAAICEKERQRRLKNGEKTPLYVHVDGSQGAGFLDIHPNKLGVDMLTLNAGKVYGPKQVGLLWAKPRIVFTPVVVGGGQERGLRSGTENVAGVIGFAAALTRATAIQKSESSRLASLRDQFESKLSGQFASLVLSGDRKKRLPGHLHVSFPGLDAERLVFRLEARGVLVATGSACAANDNTRSHVLVSIGLPNEIIDGSLRISLGSTSTQGSVTKAADIICEEVTAEYTRIAS